METGLIRKHPDAVCLMARRNFKVYAFVGPARHRLARKLVVLGTGAGPNLIRATELPAEVRRNATAGPLPDIRDANGRPLRMSGTLRLSVQLGNRLVLIDNTVCNQLAAPAIFRG